MTMTCLTYEHVFSFPENMLSYITSFFIPLEEEVDQTGLTESDKEFSFHLFYALIAFTVVLYLWETYLQLRDRRVVKATTQVPDVLKNALDEETLSKARAYTLDRTCFSLFKDLIDQCIHHVVLLLYFLPWLWLRCGEWTALMRAEVAYLQVEDGLWLEIQQSIVFSLGLVLIGTVLGLPFK